MRSEAPRTVTATTATIHTCPLYINRAVVETLRLMAGFLLSLYWRIPTIFGSAGEHWALKLCVCEHRHLSSLKAGEVMVMDVDDRSIDRSI